MQQQNRNSEFEGFCYSGERFADLQMLRYRLNGFESLSLRQKLYVYYLSKATLAGRDITTDQFGFYNLDIRKVLEAVYINYKGNKECEDFIAMTIYLKRIWFSNGIYHHYGSEKFAPEFSPTFLLDAMKSIEPSLLPLTEGETVDGLFDRLKSAIFDPSFQPKKVNKADGCDLVATSACNFYHDVSQKEVEDYYSALKATVDKNPPSFGLNSRLVKQNGELIEQVWKIDGMYGKAIETIVSYLRQAAEYAENERYVIVNDYDGDGKQEAFGFLGIRNDEYQTWESVKLYYLKSDGSVEKIALNGDVTGGPAKVSGTEQMDFSESFITLGNKTFLDFEIGYSASEPTTVLFGVNDGNYTSTSVYGYFPEKVDENHIATSDLDYRVVYKEENGIFTETMRMPGEDYEYRFASKEEYLNSMLTEEQLKDMARGLGVPEDLDVRYIQGERSYWEAGECWEIYVLVCTGNKCIASCSINPDNGEWTRNTAMYDPDHAWEVNC